MNFYSPINIDFSRYEYIQLFTLLSLTSILFINIIRQIVEDIKNNLVSSISIILFLFTSFYYYLLPGIFIIICSLSNLCFSIKLSESLLIENNIGYFLTNTINLNEKYIFIKYFILLIFSITGFNFGLIYFRKTFAYKKSYIFKSLNKFKLNEIRSHNKLGLGIFITYILFSIILIILSIYIPTFSSWPDNLSLYYSKTFGRIFSIYNFLLYPPALLICLAKTKYKELYLLSIVIVSKSLVLYFCFGRTFETINLIFISIYIFNAGLYLQFKKNILQLLNTRIKKSIRIYFFTITSFSILIFLSKIKELYKSIFDEDFLNKTTIYKPLMFYQIIGNILGTPKMISKHFLNSINLKLSEINFNDIFSSQFHPLLYPPYLNVLLPDNFLSWARNVSDFLLGKQISEVGGTTFGSALGLYSYGSYWYSIIFIILFSFLNFYILYLISNRIRITENNSNNNFSTRNYIFLLTAFPLKETLGGGLFPSGLIWYLITYYLTKKFVNFSNKLIA